MRNDVFHADGLKAVSESTLFVPCPSCTTLPILIEKRFKKEREFIMGDRMLDIP